LRRFAQDISAGWAGRQAVAEGRVDAEGESIEIVTIHSAKGLEWSIVIPINTASSPRRSDEIVYRAGDDTLHWTVGGIVSPGLAAALQAESEDLARERARLLYVACTRAKDMLILPRMPALDRSAYGRAVDLALATLPELDVGGLTGSFAKADRGPENNQDSATFQAEADRVSAAAQPILWLNPSAHDDDQVSFADYDDSESWQAIDLPKIAGAGRVRGLLLHKLIEEVLWEGLAEEHGPLTTRAEQLLPSLVSFADEATPPDCGEVAQTVLATLALPDVIALRPHLIPEVPIYAMIRGSSGPLPLAGRADALAVNDGQIAAVVDWKSDIAPDDGQREQHAAQIRLYLAATGAPRGALVYASLGRVKWIDSISD
jgi:ATP-dependent exoDNAse (exonuclease V) beta subunit